jgi:hypothetical protein
VTIVSYVPGIFPIVCAARYVARLVDPNELAKSSPFQKNIADRQQFVNDRQKSA